MTAELPPIAPLPDVSVYDGIENFGIVEDGQTFPSTKLGIFDRLIAQYHPSVIIEVGSHKGGSVHRWATATGPDCKIYCVDTWLEAADGWLVQQERKTYAVPRQNGHPMTYWQFLFNMKKWGFHRQVVPIVNTSSEGAIILSTHRIIAQIIFIDGTHSFRGCYYDLVDYWPLLAPGGAMLVDDMLVYPDTYAACLRFAAENKLWRHFETVEDKTFGLFTKP